ncbi:DLW-39 family protein [Georgenia sp. TF02-10]|nr:DLW-39 family protein [Georgenia sp. TF02-10]UNX54971.1 DLW-39 family protein [Georgenia sp. TF02-10]
MKKTFWLVAAAVTGYLAWLKVRQDREERDLWAEVTDSFGEEPVRG